MNKKTFGIVLILVSIVSLFVLSVSAQDILPNLPPPPSPDASKLRGALGATRTPSPLMFAPDDKVGPTVTPLPFKQVIDVNPNTAVEDEITIIIRKENGDFLEVFASPNQFRDGELLPQLSRLYPKLGLTSADKIFDIAPPASLMGKRPPVPPNKP
ncbi:MAG: hypothetical protein GXP38_14870 [Chloroflexi bacterium]|nr:hypothetical protein [Chloroflexota bacterium]